MTYSSHSVLIEYFDAVSFITIKVTLKFSSNKFSESGGTPYKYVLHYSDIRIFHE